MLAGNATVSVNNTTTFNSDLANSPLVQAGSYGTIGLTLTSQPVNTGGGTTFTGASGNLVFTSPVNYTGSTTVSAGTLTLNSNGALAKTAGTNAVQTLFFPTNTSNTTDGEDTGGTFFLTYNGVASAPITFVGPASTANNVASTATNIQTALNGMTVTAIVNGVPVSGVNLGANTAVATPPGIPAPPSSPPRPAPSKLATLSRS